MADKGNEGNAVQIMERGTASEQTGSGGGGFGYHISWRWHPIQGKCRGPIGLGCHQARMWDTGWRLRIRDSLKLERCSDWISVERHRVLKFRG